MTNLSNLESKIPYTQSEKDAVSEEAQQHIGHIALNLFGPEQGVDLKLPQYSAHQPLNLSE